MEITADLSTPTRLDKYLKKLYPALTQGRIEKALRLSEIKVNNAKSAASIRVNAGDKISIKDTLNLDNTDTKIRIFSDAVVALSKKIYGEYLISDHEKFIAINKPAGLATQGGSKINLSISDCLSYLTEDGLRLTHRIDKHTSGVLIIAKNYNSSVQLTKAFQDRIIKKTYLAVIEGTPTDPTGEIKSYMGKIHTSQGDYILDNNPEGKLAITQYKVLGSNGRYSLIEFKPLTGRMHQLRLHAIKLSGPVVGDAKYGKESQQMLLHSYKTTLPTELFNQEITITAAVPEYFKLFLSEIGIQNNHL